MTHCILATGAEEELVAGMQFPAQDLYSMQDDDEQQGWVSWAWSFVPAIVSYNNEDDGEGGYVGSEDGNTFQGTKSQQSKDPIISIGFYCTKATVTFKVGMPYFSVFNNTTLKR